MHICSSYSYVSTVLTELLIHMQQLEMHGRAQQ